MTALRNQTIRCSGGLDSQIDNFRFGDQIMNTATVLPDKDEAYVHNIKQGNYHHRDLNQIAVENKIRKMRLLILHIPDSNIHYSLAKRLTMTIQEKDIQRKKHQHFVH